MDLLAACDGEYITHYVNSDVLNGSFSLYVPTSQHTDTLLSIFGQIKYGTNSLIASQLEYDIKWYRVRALLRMHNQR